MEFSNAFLNNRGIQEAWRMQVLSDLTQLPDYDEGWPQWQQYNGAPVDEAGNPVYYKTPKSWDAAKNDGERWRWCQVQAVENDPNQKYPVLWQFASFMEQMYGVQSMQMGGYTPFFGGAPESDDDTKKNESGTYALHTLSEEETIARLANGIKRFKLPDEFNFIKIYKQLADDDKAGGYRETCRRSTGPQSTRTAGSIPRRPSGGRRHRGVRGRSEQLAHAAARTDRQQLGPVRDHPASAGA